MGVKIRNLTVADNRYLVKLLKKLVTELNENWLQEVVKDDDENTSSDNDENEEEKSIKTNHIFFTIINLLLEHYENELTIWFASLLDITVDEYEKLGFETDAIILEQVVESDSFKFFFQKLSDTFKTQNILTNIIDFVKGK